MPITRSQFADLLNPIIRAIYFQELGEPDEEYSKVFTLVTSKMKDEKISELTGFGITPIKTEGSDIVLDRPYQAYDYTLIHDTFGTGFVVTLEMMQDDQHGTIKKLPRVLARAHKERYETDSANILNNAFTSGTYGDGQYLIVATHPRIDGGADQSNLLAVPTDLTPTSLKAALTQMRKLRGARGEYLRIVPELLIIPPDLEFDAYEILNSVNLAGQANWNINPFPGLYNLKPQIITRLTDTDAWFLAAKKAQREPLVFYWRFKPDLEDDLHLSSRDVEYNSVMRYSVGSGGWRYIIGTPGAT